MGSLNQNAESKSHAVGIQALHNEHNMLVCPWNLVRDVRVQEPDNMSIRLSREKTGQDT